MALHYKLSDDDQVVTLKVAKKALDTANGLTTAGIGDIYIPNYDEDGFRDGTGTYIGSGSIGNGGVIEWVGDATPPGEPTGVSATSTWGVVYCKWEGTLDGGVPDDFAYVTVTIDDVEVGKLTEAGSIAADGYSDGQEVTVGFTAYDSARDRTGALSPNASETVELTVTVEDERDAIDEAVANIEQSADEAKQTAQEAWDKAENMASTVEESVQTAVDAAAQAQEIADGLSDTITDVTTTVNGVRQDVDELTATVSGISETADSALTAATEAKQTATEISSTATQALETAEGALTQATEAKQTADSISATLETDYVSKTDAETTYATKTELEATSEGLTASISEVATTADAAMTKAAEVEATAEQISTTLTSDYLSKADAETTYATQSSLTQTAESISAEVSAAATTADEALSKATSLEATVDGISTSVTAAAATAEDALTQATTAQQTVDSFKTTVEETYATKTELDESIAEEVLNRNSAIEQTATEITTTVSETYQPKGDYLTDVGGTNLLRNTLAFDNSGVDSSENGYLRFGATVQSDTYQGFTIRAATKPSTTAVGTYSAQLCEYLINEFNLGESFTFSFYVKGSTETQVRAYFYGTTGYVKAKSVASSGTYSTSYADGKTDIPVTTEWQRVYVTWELADSGDTSVDKYLLIRNDSTASGATIYVCGCKMERGTTATDWSAAPLDYTTTDELEATYATKTEVTQTADSITSTVSEVATVADNAYEKASSVEQTASGLEVRLTQAENDIDTAQSTANSAASAASDAAKTATNYLSFSSNGLVVGDMTESTLGSNARITGEGLEVRNGNTVLSSFTDDTISLGNNSSLAEIFLCGENGRIYFNSTAEQLVICPSDVHEASGSVCLVTGGNDQGIGVFSTLSDGSGYSRLYISTGYIDFRSAAVMDVEAVGYAIKAIKKVGESMTAVGYYGGYITSSGTSLRFSIPCTYATNVSSAAASSSWGIQVRADGGYEVGSSSGSTTISASNISITPRAYQHLDVAITFSAARTNNIAVAVSVNSGTIQFS